MWKGKVDMGNNENITIDKNNYKGYVELYKKYEEFSNDFIKKDTPLQKKFVCALLFVGFSYILTTIIGVSLRTITPVLDEIFETILKLDACLFMGTMVTIPIASLSNYKKCEKKFKENIDLLCEKYPYLNINISEEKLVKILKEANILEKEYIDGRSKSVWNIEEYENKIKTEKLLDEYFEDTKYNSYAINPEITQEEINKPKARKLMR